MMFLGIVVSASIIGGASTLLANLNLAAVEKRKQMDGINAFLQYRKVNTSLQDRIKDFYEVLGGLLYVHLPPLYRSPTLHTFHWVNSTCGKRVAARTMKTCSPSSRPRCGCR